MKHVVGVDAGGTKTVALVSDVTGRALGAGRAGPGNFQAVGVELAKTQVGKAVETALGEAGVAAQEVEAVFYGMAGADRPADFAIVKRFLAEINPAPRMGLENDATIALRAATYDGVGVVAICGTGTNVIGFNREGMRVQVGGLGYMFGDGAGADYIGMLAVRMATRGHDGRGKPTILYDMLCEKLHLQRLDDLIERFYPGSSGEGRVHVAFLAPLVFEAARRGDEVAYDILRAVGEELAIAVLAALRKLFSPAGPAKVVLSGGVFANADDPIMTDTLKARVLKEYPVAEFILLKDPPVLGAVLSALDLAGVEITPAVRDTLWETCKTCL
ncbi:MAG: N-acetylglucosamine kinase [Betaproteobacteria bacterium]